jgi:hypothetical protein
LIEFIPHGGGSQPPRSCRSSRSEAGVKAAKRRVFEGSLDAQAERRLSGVREPRGDAAAPGIEPALPRGLLAVSFTIESPAAPDKLQDVVLQALRVGENGKGTEVDWLTVRPQQILNMSGGKTETVVINVRPTLPTPRGEYNEVFALPGLATDWRVVMVSVDRTGYGQRA